MRPNHPASIAKSLFFVPKGSWRVPGTPRGHPRGHPGTYLASRARATIPAASGAEAEVPACLAVQRWRRSVVTWGGQGAPGTVQEEQRAGLPGVG